MSTTSVPRHILAVNHSSDLLRLMGDLLTDAGYRATTQLTATTDPASMLSLTPDLIVLDEMWFNDGWPLLQALATEPRSRTIPVVFCTALVGTVNTLPARLQGLTVRLVAKPYTLDDLLAAIAGVLPRAA